MEVVGARKPLSPPHCLVEESCFCCSLILCLTHTHTRPWNLPIFRRQIIFSNMHEMLHSKIGELVLIGHLTKVVRSTLRYWQCDCFMMMVAMLMMLVIIIWKLTENPTQTHTVSVVTQWYRLTLTQWIKLSYLTMYLYIIEKYYHQLTIFMLPLSSSSNFYGRYAIIQRKGHNNAHKALISLYDKSTELF